MSLKVNYWNQAQVEKDFPVFLQSLLGILANTCLVSLSTPAELVLGVQDVISVALVLE